MYTLTGYLFVEIDSLTPWPLINLSSRHIISSLVLAAAPGDLSLCSAAVAPAAPQAVVAAAPPFAQAVPSLLPTGTAMFKSDKFMTLSCENVEHTHIVT